jgi:hypothetical protein
MIKVHIVEYFPHGDARIDATQHQLVEIDGRMMGRVVREVSLSELKQLLDAVESEP